MDNIIKPRQLRKGDKVALISPSWGGPFCFPKLLDKAIENVQRILEVEIVEFPTCRMDSNILSEKPELRAKDINDAFADESIKAIIATIGGDDSIRILKHLDVKTILKNPKIIMGYSDSSTFLTYLNYQGLVTFNGPTMLSGWAQIHNYPDAARYYRSLLYGEANNDNIPTFNEYSEGYPDWGNDNEIGKINPKKSNSGPCWLQGNSVTCGKLWGGCIEVVDWLKGTKFWPEESFWDNRILFFETSDDKPTPDEVGFSLRNLGVQGVLDKIQGLMFGRASGYSDEEKEELNSTILNIVNKEFGNSDLPIITNLDFGHTDPNLILPLGIEYEINSKLKSIKRTEEIFN